MAIFNKITIGIFILSMSLCSCGDFLEETSQDEIKPSTVDDLRALMYNDAYPYLFSSGAYLELLTDEYTCNGLQNTAYAGYHENGAAIFSWNPEMFDGNETFPTDADSWKIYYVKIKGCNVVKDYLSKVYGTDADKNALLGQVLFLRAFYYLKLVLTYGQPYSGTGIDPQTSLGVPLILTMDVSDDYPVRNTLKEVYDQIESDLLESANLLETYYDPESAFRIGAPAAYVLLSRFYLYRGLDSDMEKVVAYATKGIEEGPDLTNLYSFKANFGNKGIYDTDVSKEALWIYGFPTYQSGTYYTTTTSGNIEPYTVSTNLLNMYDQTNDLRYQSYFYRLTDTSTGLTFPICSRKVGTSQKNYGDRGIRIAEAYLNRAEALAWLYKSGGDDAQRVQALQDLNDLRYSRYAQNTYTDVSITDADSLLQFCHDERFRELCLEEGFRWFDIKRLGLSATHTYVDTEGNQTVYTLKSGDLLYALPIPYTAIERNYKLVQNPR
ncbi:MAG: RagB/SusD family nutrient uptake outer membrane protein [Bacteroidetes bacterium]|jgi:starch-binding outer membrane protein, SusD/RagB family|nr:RagB/SusD family nutrient uptake outer membrane protein [Bacteroidota bacterium]